MKFLREKRNNKPKMDEFKQFFVDGKVITLKTHRYQEANGNVIQLKVAGIFGNQQVNRFVPEKYLIFGLGENQNIDNDFLQKVVDTYHIQGDNGTIIARK